MVILQDSVPDLWSFLWALSPQIISANLRAFMPQTCCQLPSDRLHPGSPSVLKTAAVWSATMALRAWASAQTSQVVDETLRGLTPFWLHGALWFPFMILLSHQPPALGSNFHSLYEGLSPQMTHFPTSSGVASFSGRPSLAIHSKPSTPHPNIFTLLSTFSFSTEHLPPSTIPHLSPFTL